MYHDLLRQVAVRPAPYQRTEHPFWDDPHISQGMLGAHLDPDAEGATRPLAFVRRSADWIASLGQGALLDLGCGPGVYAEQLAERGFSVTGIDLSQRSIEHARASAGRKGLQVEYIQDDYIRHAFDAASFDIAALIYCDYGVLPPEARRALLARVRTLLRPAGRFVLEAWTPAHLAARAEGWTMESCEAGGFFAQRPYVQLKLQAGYPHGVHLDRYLILTEEGLKDYNIWNQAFTVERLERELSQAGFETIEWYGDVAGAPHSEESPTICAVAHA